MAQVEGAGNPAEAARARRWRFGQAVFDESTWELIVNGHAVAVERKPLEVLRHLLEHSGKAVTRDQLIAAVWPKRILSDSALTSTVARLREAIQDDAQHIIRTLHGHGYRLVAPVICEEAPATPVVSDPGAGDAATPGTARQPWDIPSLAMAPSTSIAVLPFANIGSDVDNEYLCDGMTEELLNAFARIDDVTVPSRTSVFAFKGKPMDIREIGRSLRVRTVLEGSIQRQKNLIRVSARLINVADGYRLWAETYERPVDDIFVLQDSIARSIVGVLRPRLLAEQQSRLVHQGTVSPEAYDAFQRGRYEFAHQNDVASRVAIEYLEKALALDPAFARAHAALARVIANRIYLIAADEDGARDRGFGAARKALALDPSLAEAHLALAQLIWTPFDNFPHEETLRELQTAVGLDNGLAEAWLVSSVVFAHVGLLPQAELAIERAIALAPDNLGIRVHHAAMALYVDHWADALDRVKRIPPDFNPTVCYSMRASALSALGKRDEALACLNEFLVRYPDRGGLVTSHKARLCAARGDADSARKALAAVGTVDRRFGNFHHAAYNLAGACAHLGRTEEALDWLTYVVDNGFPCYPVLQRDRALARLADEPRFQKVMAGCREHWQRFDHLFPLDEIGRRHQWSTPGAPVN